MDLTLFKQILSAIKQHEEANRKLTDLVVSKDCTGFCSFGEELVTYLILLLAKAMNDKYDYISWWLWETSSYHVWDETYEYDLEDPKDLYYFLKGDYTKVKKRKKDDAKNTERKRA